VLWWMMAAVVVPLAVSELTELAAGRRTVRRELRALRRASREPRAQEPPERPFRPISSWLPARPAPAPWCRPRPVKPRTPLSVRRSRRFYHSLDRAC